MELLRRLASFGPSLDDLRNIYILFVRSQLEQSAVVWHSSLTEQNRNDLERVQKSALKVILGEKYQSYNKALIELNLETLEERRNTLCLRFAQKCLTNEKNQQMFPLSKKIHSMETRKSEEFEVQYAKTDRLKNSAKIYMQNLLNEG